MELPFFETYYNFLKEYSDRRHSPRYTRAAQARRTATTKFKKKIRPRSVVFHPCGEMRRSWTARWDTAFFTRAGDTSFFVRAARCVVLAPPGEIQRSSPARRDPSFFNRPVRYDVLQPGAEIRRSAAQPSIYTSCYTSLAYARSGNAHLYTHGLFICICTFRLYMHTAVIGWHFRGKR